MNKKLLYWLSALVLAVVLGVVAFIIWGGSVEPPPIAIPSPSPSSGEDGPGGNDNRIEVDAGVVQELLARLEPADAYSRGYQLWTYWEGGSSEAAISAWRKGDSFRVSHRQNNVVKNTLVLGDQVHSWYEGSNQVFSARLSEAGDGAMDEFARLITLDELMAVPAESILSAGYEDKQGESCIFVEYEIGSRIYRLHVSVEKGLLISAEAVEDGKTIYKMESVITESTIPADEIFLLP